MGKVIRGDFTKQSDSPMAGVLALCMDCEMRWVQLITLDESVFDLECPECGHRNSYASFAPDEYLVEMFGED